MVRALFVVGVNFILFFLSLLFLSFPDVSVLSDFAFPVTHQPDGCPVRGICQLVDLQVVYPLPSLFLFLLLISIVGLGVMLVVTLFMCF